MNGMKAIFSGCYSMMQLPISLFGFDITLWQLFIFTSLSYCVVRLVYGFFK